MGPPTRAPDARHQPTIESRCDPYSVDFQRADANTAAVVEAWLLHVTERAEMIRGGRVTRFDVQEPVLVVEGSSHRLTVTIREIGVVRIVQVAVRDRTIVVPR